MFARALARGNLFENSARNREGGGIVGKHAIQQGKLATKRGKAKKNQRRAVKTGAVSIAGLLCGGMVLASHTGAAGSTTVHEDVSLAASIVFIDGHKYPDSGTRMLTELQGNVQVPNPNCIAPCLPLTQPIPGTTFYFVQYPATLGLLDGPGAPTGDQSVTTAQQNLQTYLQNNPPNATTNPVTVTAYSEGAVAASHEVANWPAGSGIAFVLIADPERPNGGILARFPAGTYIPLIGITAGNATPAGGAPVVMVTRQYDGVADAPVYVGNVLADMNAFLGFYYLHSTYYSVNPNDPTNIVTTSPDGTMTDILVPAAPGALPIFMPLAQAGVPQAVLVALDPAVRALIETGYVRTTDPSQQVMFAFLPPPSAWSTDAQAIAAGFALTAQELPAALAAGFPSLPGLPLPLPTATSPTLSPTPVTSPLASSPVPITAAPLNSPVPQTRLVTQTQPVTQPQPTTQAPPTTQTQQAVTNPANTAAGEVGQQSTLPPTLSTNVSASGSGSSQPVSTPTDTASAKKVTSSSTGNGSGASARGNNAVADVENGTGSVTGHLPKSTSTSSTSSQATSGSSGSAASHKKS
jgi:hypothetical protein